MPLQMTKAQMASGYAQSDEAFAAWYIKDVMEPHHPDLYYVLTEEGRTERVIRARELARRNGLNEPAAQAYFVGMMFDIGSNFYLFDGFRDALARSDLSELERVEQFLDGTVTDAQAVHAILNASEAHWWDNAEAADG